MREIERLGEEWGISIARRETGKGWDAYLAECRAEREALGLPMPADYREPGSFPALGPKPDGLQAPARGNRSRWADEEEVAGIVTAYVLDTRSRGATPSQADYATWARGHRDRPSASTLDRAFGRGFSAWVRLAEERLLAEKKAA